MAGYQAASRRGSVRALRGVRRAADRRPLALAAFAFAAVCVTHLIDYGAYGLRYRILDASSASSWSHRADVTVLAVGAVICCLGGLRGAQGRRAWATLGGILLFFFIDEVTSLHSHVGQLSYGKLLYAPILLVLMVCVWRVTVGAHNMAILLAGLGLLLTSYAIHIVGPHVARTLGWGNDSWAYQIKVAVKEGTECAGLLLAAWALVTSALAPSEQERPVHRYLITPGWSRPDR